MSIKRPSVGCAQDGEFVAAERPWFVQERWGDRELAEVVDKCSLVDQSHLGLRAPQLCCQRGGVAREAQRVVGRRSQSAIRQRVASCGGGEPQDPRLSDGVHGCPLSLSNEHVT